MTENLDKFREAKSILTTRGIKIRRLKRAKVEVQDSSLERIAEFAVKRASTYRRGLMLVEDSGLFIDAPNGFPGPSSSYVCKTIGLKAILCLIARRRRTGQYHYAIAERPGS